MNRQFFTLFSIALFAIAGCQFETKTSQHSNVKNLRNWPYREVIETSGATSYIFEGVNKPPISLGGNAQILNYEEVNTALLYIGLPMVDRNVPEQESVTGSRVDRASYHWDDYSLGKLIVKRTTATGNGGDVIVRRQLQ